MPYIGSQPTKVVSQQSSRVYRYTATADQTVFSGADVDNQVLNVTPSDVEVHMNGLLLDPTDYTVTSSSVTLGTAANAGDELTITGMVTFEVADTYDKTTADARYVNAAGDTMTGALALPSAGLTVGTDQLAVDSAGRVTMPYQPAFSAWNVATASQSPVTADIWATFDSNLTNWSSTHWHADTNAGSSFSTSNGRFTAPVSGNYRINLHVSYLLQNTVYIVLFKNGAYVAPYALAYTTTNSYQSLSISSTLPLSVGDYVEAGGYMRSATNIAGSGYINFSGHLIG
jgi:hypothetical protein